MKKLPPLSARLGSAVEYIRENTFLADVGTDHAYLPVWLWCTGKIRGAIASDINEKPLGIARKHICEFHAEEGISTLCTDGLHGIETYAPRDITIFGMGGEMIARILDEAPWVKNPDVRLILQPMTKAEILRRYLAEHGFCVPGETLTKDEQKIYQTLCATFDGKKREISDLEALIGTPAHYAKNRLYREYLSQKRRVLEKIVVEKKTAGVDCTYENGILWEMEAFEKEKGE